MPSEMANSSFRKDQFPSIRVIEDELEMAILFSSSGQFSYQSGLTEDKTRRGMAASSDWTDNFPLTQDLTQQLLTPTEFHRSGLLTPTEFHRSGLEKCEILLDETSFAHHHDKSFSMKPYLQRDYASKVTNENADQVDRLIANSFHRINSLIDKSDVRYSTVRLCIEAAERFGLSPLDVNKVTDSKSEAHLIDNQSAEEAFPPTTVVEGGWSAGKHFCDALSEFFNLAISRGSEVSFLFDNGIDTLSAPLATFDANMHPIIGGGAQGTVHLCQGPQAEGGAIAVKVLTSLSPTLNLELRMLHLPGHSNVSALLAARIDPLGPQFKALLAYPLAEGGTVAAVLRSGGAAGYPTVCRWVVQALRGLQHLHRVAGMAHHDVKPDNLLLRGSAGGGQLLLCDFGCCAFMGSRCKDAPGTPLYMSPTQARGNFIADHRADVWALGVCAIEALTGAHPLLHPPPGPAAAHAPVLDSAPAQMFHVGMLRQPPRLPCGAAAAGGDGRLAAFVDAALAVVPAAGWQGRGLLDAAGASADALLARMGGA